jgi:hypothetical protein
VKVGQGGGEVAVSQSRLHLGKRGTATKRVRAVRMAQPVLTDILGDIRLRDGNKLRPAMCSDDALGGNQPVA